MKQHNNTLRCLSLLGSVLVATLAAPLAPAAEVVVGINREIFGNQAAADMVKRARSFDPNYSQKRQPVKAIALYEKAIALQPGAKINAALCDRIAQLYSYTAWPGKDHRTGWARGSKWWRRCIQEANPRQLLWAQAQMGLGCTTFLSRKPDESVAAFKAILTVDPEKMDLPQWKAWPADTELGRSRRESELRRIQKRAREIRLKAVEKIHYVLMRADRQAVVPTLLQIVREYRGTPVAQRAAELAAEFLRKTSHRL